MTNSLLKTQKCSLSPAIVLSEPTSVKTYSKAAAVAMSNNGILFPWNELILYKEFITEELENCRASAVIVGRGEQEVITGTYLIDRGSLHNVTKTAYNSHKLAESVWYNLLRVYPTATKAAKSGLPLSIGITREKDSNSKMAISLFGPTEGDISWNYCFYSSIAIKMISADKGQEALKRLKRSG